MHNSMQNSCAMQMQPMFCAGELVRALVYQNECVNTEMFNEKLKI